MTHDKDMPQWLSAITLTIIFSIIPISVFVVNPPYLTSATGYAIGGHIYMHMVEAIKVKDLLRNLTTNFWFDGSSLGYPMFMKSHPLSCISTAIVMLLTER